MDIRVRQFSQAAKLDPRHLEAIRLNRIKHAIHENHLEPVDPVIKRRLIRGVMQRGCRGLRLHKSTGLGIAPVFVPGMGQPHLCQARKGGFAGLCKAARRIDIAENVQTGGGIRIPLGRGLCQNRSKAHQAISARMSA